MAGSRTSKAAQLDGEKKKVLFVCHFGIYPNSTKLRICDGTGSGGNIEDSIFPWTAAIFLKAPDQSDFSYACDGVVLSERHVLAGCGWESLMKSVTLGNVTMSHRTRERPAECLASLSHSTMIGLPRAALEN
ncbi:hypothetical protein EVAR_95861_1 [Eumeta japonica]|uniref:Uncharacterized protein n=1 Tax=Eumeta variegata TaxID=151549 RepID=A0A4C1VMM9_EUMVA|nr:hypothetical protein EVAR_95861_1 [Eumeta japonica]